MVVMQCLKPFLLAVCLDPLVSASANPRDAAGKDPQLRPAIAPPRAILPVRNESGATGRFCLLARARPRLLPCEPLPFGARPRGACAGGEQRSRIAWPLPRHPALAAPHVNTERRRAHRVDCAAASAPSPGRCSLRAGRARVAAGGFFLCGQCPSATCTLATGGL
eukprot:363663-Chlamydomonas_euryale.AAC.2